MNIFVLEDNAGRINVFAAKFLNHALTICNNADQALKILKVEKFNVIFLDHDLGGKTFVSEHHENTGSYVCKHMHETLNVDTDILIHSWNDVAANSMMGTLADNVHKGCVKYIPYDMPEFHQYVDGFNMEQSDELKSSYQIVIEKKISEVENAEGMEKID